MRISTEHLQAERTEGVIVVSPNDAAAAADGAVRLIERLSPALEPVDGSSGAVGSAVNGAIATLVPIISSANVPISMREKWLERLYEVHAADQVPYIEILADCWVSCA